MSASAQISIPADVVSARFASAWLESLSTARGVPREQFTRLDHCLDEAIANIIAHGGESARASPIVLQFSLLRDHDATTCEVTVTDSGTPFDPARAPRKSPPSSLEDAEPGGLGLTMIRSYSDILRYRRVEGRNSLTFGVRWTEAR